MSLNGLDDVKAKEAHEAALAEAGGWFLLNYVTRDEVQLLARGSGGVTEMRTNVEQYEEPSPLFGFLRYRRRNVLIKYTPEGTSRLIQARSTVHFNAVCERFGPCETSIDITEAKELSETKLSHACSLHTASASTSSSHGSMRRRRLGEIAEEGEEEEQREAKRQSVLGEQNTPGEIDDGPARPRSPITGPPVILDPSFATSPKDTTFADTAEPPSFSGVPRPASPAKSIESDFQRRLSSQSARQEYSGSPSYPYSKARVRLGPRPLTEQAGRPRSAASDVVRPVAAMPAGLRLALKGGKSVKTQDDSSSIINEESSEPTLLIPVASMTEPSILRPRTSEGRPVVSSSASVKSLPAISQPVKQAMTPEKLRLMKALQLREKKKRATAAPEVPVPSVEITPSPAAETGIEIVEPVAEETNIQNTLVRVPTDTESELTADEMTYSKTDSAIDTASTAPTDHTSEHTHSRPHSPNCASSEIDDSTKASSVSESTDETVHPQGDKADTADPQVIEEEALTHETSAGETDEKAISPSEVAEGSSVEGLTISTATLGQPEQSSGAPDAGLPTTEDAKYAQGASDIVNNLVPKSKFAANLPSGQAVMDPLEIRGRDPPNVTSGPGRIDEADPGDVGPLQRTEDGTGATSSKWNLPTSKYSTLDSSKSLAPSPNSAIATTFPDKSLNGQDRSADASDKMVDDGATDEKRRSERPEPLLMDFDLPEKPAPQQDEPVTVEPQPATNDFEDAMSTMVHSPVTETPPQPCEPPTPRILRTVSSPVASPHSVAGDAPLTASRSISSGSMAFHQKMNHQHTSTHLAPRTPGKLGGGLASRIKAFEQLATKTPPGGSANSGAAGRPSSAFFSIQRNSVRDGARSPSVLERTNSIYRGRTATPESLDGSPEFTIGTSARSRSGSVASRMSVFEGGNAPRGRPETVQVTAKIVREPGQMYPRAPGSQADTSEYAPMELKQSPLIVDHRKSVDVSEFMPAANAPPVPTPLVHAGGERRQSRHERTLSKESKISLSDDSLHRPGQRTSLTMARDFIRDSMAGKDSPTQARPPSVHQSSSLLSRLSINTRRKSIPHEPSLLSPTDTNKSESGDENKSKEGSRASRLMHRLSSTFSPGRKQSVTTSPPILAEEFDAEEAQPQSSHSVPMPTTPSMPEIMANMGDVNVQFPENLLWKRRTTYLDSTGFLHLTPAQGAVSAREKQLKRFHMSEFKVPYTPEIEFQELANSVCLDLKSGSGLQIAFQDRAGQLNGLQILQAAHQKYTSYGH